MSIDVRPTHLEVDAPRAGTREWLALGVLMLPVLLIAIDNTILSFALPAISRDLAPTATQLLWIVDVYPLMLAGLLVAMGTLGDRLGRRLLLLVGAGGFGAVSLVAAYSTSPEALIVARALLGIFGATLMPSTLSLLRNLFLHRDQRRLAIAVWASAFAGGAAIGPLLGGWLLEHFWWGSVFVVNVPVMVALVALTLALVPESRDPHPGPVDLRGLVLSLATMFPVVYAIKLVAKDGVTTAAGLSLLVGVVAGVAFVRHCRRTPHAMLDVSLFSDRVFSGAVVANLLSLLSLAGFLFLVSQFLQLVAGLSPLDAGLVLLPGLAVTVATGLLSVRLVRYVPLHVLVGASFALSAAGYAVIAFVGDVPTVLGVMVGFVAVGAGVGLAETLTNDAIQATAPPEKAGAASGISETAYEVGAVLGTAVLGSILLGIYRAEVVVPASVAPGDAETARETLGGATELASTMPDSAAAPFLESAHLAFDAGVQTSSTVAIGVALAAAAVSYLTLRPR